MATTGAHIRPTATRVWSMTSIQPSWVRIWNMDMNAYREAKAQDKRMWERSEGSGGAAERTGGSGRWEEGRRKLQSRETDRFDIWNTVFFSFFTGEQISHSWCAYPPLTNRPSLARGWEQRREKATVYMAFSHINIHYMLMIPSCCPLLYLVEVRWRCMRLASCTTAAPGVKWHACASFLASHLQTVLPLPPSSSLPPPPLSQPLPCPSHRR